MAIQGYPRFRALLADGSPAVGYKLQSFLAGTSTPTPTYADQALTAANPNPLILDGNGEGAVWLDPAIAYKLVLRTDADVDVWTLDGIQTREAGLFTTLNVNGAATFATVSASGQITSTVATGTAPLVVASTTKVANLNADLLDGKHWIDPGPIGGSTPGDGTFNLLTAIGNATHKADRILETAQAGKWIQGQITEDIVLSTAGATTDSAFDLLPANSIIEGVIARVTQAITVATNWALGDATVAARFLAATTDLALGTTKVGLAHRNPDVAANAGPVQSAAAKLRITTTGTPGAGRIRVTVFFSTFVPPAS